MSDYMENPVDLNWCLFVIQNDFLQISNSMLTTSPKNGRRFSKTQRMMNFEESLDIGIINNWVSTMLTKEHASKELRRNSLGSAQSNSNDKIPKHPKIDLVKKQLEYPITDEMLCYIDDSINSNNFNCFDLNNATKKNSLYFMLQYVY
jgi:hypothetical protein